MEESVDILIIDDEEVIRDSCTQILSTEGYGVRSAEDGPAGLKMMQERLPDIVILDLRMPGMDGMEVLEKIGSRYPGVLVIVITGYATIESAVEAMKQGADDYLAKPFVPDVLRTSSSGSSSWQGARKRRSSAPARPCRKSTSW
jgi:two-component system phosphate regulon sensor histidine kinase PhoR